jgi:hypothetical protein
MVSRAYLLLSNQTLIFWNYLPSIARFWSGDEHRKLMFLWDRSKLMRHSLAAALFQSFIASDTSSENLSGLKRLHGLMPYMILKGVLKISNPVGMIRGLPSFTRASIVFLRSFRGIGSLPSPAFRWAEFITEVCIRSISTF